MEGATSGEPYEIFRRTGGI